MCLVFFFPAYQTCVCVWHADTGNGARCKMKASLMSHRNIQDEDVGLSITGFSVCVCMCVSIANMAKHILTNKKKLGSNLKENWQNTNKVLFVWGYLSFWKLQGEKQCEREAIRGKATATGGSVFVLGADFRLLGAEVCFDRTNSYLYCLTGIQNFIAFPNCHTQRSNVKLAIVERVETWYFLIVGIMGHIFRHSLQDFQTLGNLHLSSFLARM